MKLHKPLSVVYLWSNVSCKMETDVTCEYKRTFGSQNVQGGRWCDVDDHQKVTACSKLRSSYIKATPHTCYWLATSD